LGDGLLSRDLIGRRTGMENFLEKRGEDQTSNEGGKKNDEYSLYCRTECLKAKLRMLGLFDSLTHLV
jgi:hypothetical protein